MGRKQEEISPWAKKRAKWASVFGSTQGKEVLKEMLEELHVFESINPEDASSIALRNYGLEVMQCVGILDGSNDNDYMARIVGMVH